MTGTTHVRSDLTSSVAAVRTLFDAAACSCALVDADGETLHFAAADGAGAAGIIGVEMPVVARHRGLGGDLGPAHRGTRRGHGRALRP